MEQNAYKNELNQVVYTEAGRAALTEALLEARPAPRRRSWTRKGFAALLAAVLLALTNWVGPAKKLHPIVFIALSAVVGVAFGFAGA